MLKKRIIPCLDIKDGQTVKGVNFVDIRSAGDPIELAKRYVKEGADELVFLDITATVDGRKTFAALVKEIAYEINIPFTVGGGISSVEDAGVLVKAGADKVSINSAAVKRPELVKEIADEFGSQFVVVAIDAGLVDGEWKVFVKGGREATELDVYDWAKQVEALGAGEILLTSMANDGTKNGFAIELTGKLATDLNIPVIASGGAGASEHFQEVFEQTKATGALAASVFHFREIPIPELKKELSKQNIEVRI
ncbi:imidazole glycerol phosphate synthase subunit HisF [Ekhidna sp. MALMAid0563]|uniref:imidazole glycerol phosphate synthase subunit HisF n=1 Tax=Ekhidna sp. MALMAid0563 TaxID=3143937 RepID=UPI0032DF64A6